MRVTWGRHRRGSAPMAIRPRSQEGQLLDPGLRPQATVSAVGSLGSLTVAVLLFPFPVLLDHPAGLAGFNFESPWCGVA